MNTSHLDRYTLKHYTRLMISFFGCLAVLTVFQYTALYFKGVVDTIFGSSILIAMVHQIGFTALVGIILTFPFNFWENFRPRYGFVVTIGVLMLLLIMETLLIAYFITTLVPLGSDLLGYSLSDIKITLSNSGGQSLYVVLAMAVTAGLFIGFYKITSKFYHRISKMYPFTIILFSLFVATLFSEGKPINQNKTQYLAINLYQSTTEDNSYVADEEFPLIKRPEMPDVLGSYFNLKQEKPNIVFIMVEGLGRDFVGEGAEYGGFTPFLDSLTTKSLYWENCLSTTGRTFGVLPGMYGSLPFGKSGFMELDEYPNKLTLFGILKNNDYHTSFYQGTNSTFDNVDRFLRSEEVDFVLDKSGFGSNFKLQAEDAAGFSWGYPDKELFKKSMSLPREENQPRMEVYMTISTHEPFEPPSPEYYKKRVGEFVEKGNYSSKMRRVIEKNDGVFGSLLYTDDALKWVFEAYKRQPNYENTIFVVTGDHRLIPIPQRNALSRFHVPLIIYSPLLNTTRKMSSVSSHFDVAPTLLAMLDKAYKLKMPKKVAWMGGTLDTQEAFRSIKDIPLMRNKNELKEFISGTKLYTDGDVMEFDENMDLSASFGGGSKLENKLDNFKAMNQYVTTNNKIIPDSLAIFTEEKTTFKGTEIVWINSVYNGQNIDKAYFKARDFAFDKDFEKALLLCRYILSEKPGHIDTKILMGRINAWEGAREKSIEILRDCIKMNPNYIDSYSALFDVYYWEGKDQEAMDLIKTVQQNSSDVNEIKDKIERAKKEYGKRKNTASIQEIKTMDKVTDAVATDH